MELDKVLLDLELDENDKQTLKSCLELYARVLSDKFMWDENNMYVKPPVFMHNLMLEKLGSTARVRKNIGNHRTVPIEPPEHGCKQFWTSIAKGDHIRAWNSHLATSPADTVVVAHGIRTLRNITNKMIPTQSRKPEFHSTLTLEVLEEMTK